MNVELSCPLCFIHKLVFLMGAGQIVTSLRREPGEPRSHGNRARKLAPQPRRPRHDAATATASYIRDGIRVTRLPRRPRHKAATVIAPRALLAPRSQPRATSATLPDERQRSGTVGRALLAPRSLLSATNATLPAERTVVRALLALRD
ncbi:hypothetical protein CYMTET_15615 [Cymbomonas tetramitiformis]|uniref:Uncharacterized protein n=1 Tax=Cymbomonas tetramitiformis TaxID=36881 RepID=A0AAE0GE33_9CHLO|nr:hypothetical protein CYMTET_15615 [Cymbomonas tetramitiformis]